MSMPIRSMSASRFSIEVNWTRLRSACWRLTSRVHSLAYSSRGCRVAVGWPATISAALGVSTWQWMSMVNHLPRACAGPGKRPGISAPGGRHLNSISGSSPRLSSIVWVLSRGGERSLTIAVNAGKIQRRDWPQPREPWIFFGSASKESSEKERPQRANNSEKQQRTLNHETVRLVHRLTNREDDITTLWQFCG